MDAVTDFLLFHVRKGLDEGPSARPDHVIVRAHEIVSFVDGARNGAELRVRGLAEKVFTHESALEVLAAIAAHDAEAQRQRRALALVELIALTAEGAGAATWAELHAMARALAKEPT